MSLSQEKDRFDEDREQRAKATMAKIREQATAQASVPAGEKAAPTTSRFPPEPPAHSATHKPGDPRRLLSLLSSDERKKYPVATGCLDYFPDAVAVVSNVSYRGNEKHNPGQPLHWARGKSMDHADCVARHLIGRDGYDGEILEAGAMAWRALADLQELLERKYALDPPRGATVPVTRKPPDPC